MVRFDWFEECDGDDLSTDQRGFLAGLRARANSWTDSWRCRPENSRLAGPDPWFPHWRAVLDVPARTRNLSLITIGVCFDDAHVWGGELHNQSFYPEPADQQAVEPIDITGTPQRMAVVTADWFERVLARPVTKLEWDSPDGIAYSYRFSDTDTGLVKGGPWFQHSYPHRPDRVIADRGSHPAS
jgi:hypothetical protein